MLQAWALRVDVHVLDHDGNLAGACALAALAALAAFRLPDTEVAAAAGDNAKPRVAVLSPDVREPRPLSLHQLPLAVGFALFEVPAPLPVPAACPTALPSPGAPVSVCAQQPGSWPTAGLLLGLHEGICRVLAPLQEGELLVVDPGLKEEAACAGALLVVVDTHGDVCSLAKTSGAGVPMSQVPLGWAGFSHTLLYGTTRLNLRSPQGPC